VSGGLPAVEELRVRPGNPVRVMLAQRLADAAEILAKLGGECAAEYKYDGIRVQAHRTADGRPLGSLATGDALVGSTITHWELVPYGGDRTYDLLPAGPTGSYCAHGVLLSSTLS